MDHLDELKAIVEVESNGQSEDVFQSSESAGLPPNSLGVDEAALQYDILDHLDELKAIVEVESNGQSEDVFQSSESAGLPPNSLGVDESIDQGVRYYRLLLDKAELLGVDQDAVYQAYNYGSGYLDFVAQHGKQHIQELAEEFSRIHSNGRIVTYPNQIAVESNGGWRYDYGNMFYVCFMSNSFIKHLITIQPFKSSIRLEGEYSSSI